MFLLAFRFRDAEIQKFVETASITTLVVPLACPVHPLWVSVHPPHFWQQGQLFPQWPQQEQSDLTLALVLLEWGPLRGPVKHKDSNGLCHKDFPQFTALGPASIVATIGYQVYGISSQWATKFTYLCCKRIPKSCLMRSFPEGFWHRLKTFQFDFQLMSIQGKRNVSLNFG